MKMRYPIQELMSEEGCYERLLEILHPEGMQCPDGHRLPEGQAPHSRERAPVNKYRCRECGKVYDAFTNTVWSGTHYNCVTIVLVMRGIIQGTPTLHLSEELSLNYSTLLERRHRIQNTALLRRSRFPFSRFCS
ncbi:hypothetical protein KFU94_49740 [Chloroflexi bacterium TSY]|nr:hypothetical protein [Chloroflexi bacterium TSY]